MCLSYVRTVLGRTPVRWMASCSSFFTAAIAASPTTLMTHPHHTQIDGQTDCDVY
jgi:hypothetical protein